MLVLLPWFVSHAFTLPFQRGSPKRPASTENDINQKRVTVDVHHPPDRADEEDGATFFYRDDLGNLCRVTTISQTQIIKDIGGLPNPDPVMNNAVPEHSTPEQVFTTPVTNANPGVEGVPFEPVQQPQPGPSNTPRINEPCQYHPAPLLPGMNTDTFNILCYSYIPKAESQLKLVPKILPKL